MDFITGNLVIILVALVISITVHEAMHAFMSYWLGDDTAKHEGRITLNPLPHIDPLLTIALPMAMLFLGLPPILAAKPVPFNPNRVRYEEFGVALVALAGPVSNFALALLGSLAFHILDPVQGTFLYNAILGFITINIGLMVFNLLPIPPLDGSRVLYAFSPAPLQRLMEQIESLGLIPIMFILLFMSQFIGPILSTVGRTILQAII